MTNVRETDIIETVDSTKRKLHRIIDDFYKGDASFTFEFNFCQYIKAMLYAFDSATAGFNNGLNFGYDTSETKDND